MNGKDLSAYYEPARGPEAEKESNQSQASTFVQTEAPKELERAMSSLKDKYPESTDPFPQLRREYYWKYVIIPHVKSNATPGHPLAQESSRNDQILNDPEMCDYVISLAIQRIAWLSVIDVSWLAKKLEVDPLWSIKKNLSDVMRMFVKNEPHPERKIKNKRWRLIFVMSLVDNLVDRFLFTNQDQADLENWRTIPSKCGSGLSDEDGQSYSKYILEKGLNVATDIQAWDSNVKPWMLYADIEIRRKLNNGSQQWYRAAMNVTTLAIHRVTMSSDGELTKRVLLGGQTSGRKVTSSSNSRMRALLAEMAGERFGYRAECMSQGDDSIERLPWSVSDLELKAFYEECGFNLRSVEPVDHTKFSFCSQVYTNGNPCPESTDKTLCSIASAKVFDEDYVRSLKHDLRHHPELDAIITWAVKVHNYTGPL